MNPDQIEVGKTYEPITSGWSNRKVISIHGEVVTYQNDYYETTDTLEDFAAWAERVVR